MCVFVRAFMCVGVCARASRRNVRGGWLTWKTLLVKYVSNGYGSFEINL